MARPQPDSLEGQTSSPGTATGSAQGEASGVPVYGGRGLPSKHRSLQTGSWEDDEWPPERMVQYHGPATWAEDGSWGYRTPSYMLSRIIRLQAVVEIIPNETAKALNLWAGQQTKMRNAIFQNRLALDYSLAAEGGVCGKFSVSNCCLQIDDKGKVIEEITDKMTKIAHVPVQTWKGWHPGELFGGWFSYLGGFKTLVGTVLLLLGTCLLLPCLLPLFMRVASSLAEATVDRRATAHLLAPGPG
ncbi:endogenous retrovirus group 3 member 1 Env polyprotein-like [Hippopotamus amphibius kiboko]|uniref:endogenous retrovirus group 3 member 1 Env polyprotein-like n=1 Tax=Hippopotamus amphibius kiboko TaxID=575201 RepID=UPI00259AC083|nr:endogenous retrovirus group 3 member 1 Env polyprotein-like [Hippopotamus amphibius kiboko]